MTQAKVYFPGLNGLRFFAALAVVITHVELMKRYLGFDSFWYDADASVSTYPLGPVLEGKHHWLSAPVAALGPLGVVFFFVLSGFLITYLLLVERQKTQTIGIGKFYLRRIFRIWPLYFLIFVLGFFVLPHFDLFYVPDQSEAFADNFWGNFWSYLFILPNLALAMYLAVPCIGQSWSIGVEEQFYLIWPVLVKWFKKPLHAIIWVTAILLAIKAAVLFADRLYDHHWLTVFKKFLAMSKIECMTIGALGAYLIYNRQEKLIRFVHQKWVQLLTYAGIIGLIYLTPAKIQDGIHLVYGVLFLIVILNVSGNLKSLVKLENKVLNLFGTISYGIYMYHLIIVVLVVHVFRNVLGKGADLGIGGNLGIYLSSIVLTLFVSWLSYRYFELWFIRKKSKYSKVISGNEAR